MAGTEQKQLLALIRDFASEKSQGERRVTGLKKRNQELQSEIKTENEELDKTKRLKETAENNFKGYEVKLAILDGSFQTLESRNCLAQSEISTVNSEVEKLKEGEALRDIFIGQMIEANCRIRKFHQTISSKLPKQISNKTAAEKKRNKLAQVTSEIQKEEQMHLAEKNVKKQLEQQYADLQKKVSLMEMIMKERESLQDMGRQTSELEQTCAVLGEELQKRCACPNCHKDNIEEISGLVMEN
ncbi:hypothetical protein LINPERHAP2_LOCUS24682 [Linum perenne]